MKIILVPAIVLTAFASWLFFCWPALYALHLRWVYLDGPYSIGYPTVIMSLWWFINRRHAILSGPIAPAYTALPLLLLALMASAAGSLIYLQIVPQLAVPLLMWLLLGVVFGWRASFAAIAPCAVLYLAIPWLDIGYVLRAMTVWFSQHMLDWLHVPALIDGFTISLVSGVIHVAGSCSGFNLLLSAVFIGLMYGEMAEQNAVSRVLFVMLAAVIGIIDNWIRVLALVLVAHYSNMTSELVYHHGSFGWWIFAASLVPYFLMARRLERSPSLAVQEVVRGTSVSWPFKRMVFAALVATMMMWGTVATMGHLQDRSGESAGFAIPQTAIAIRPSWLPHYQGQGFTQAFSITNEAGSYEILALTYIHQRFDKKLISYDNYIADEEHLREMGRVAIDPDFTVNTAVVHNGSSRVVWWFWWVDGKTSASALKTKLLQLTAMLMGDPSASLVLLSSPCLPADCAAAAELTAPVRQLLRNLSHLPAVKSSQPVVPRSE